MNRQMLLNMSPLLFFLVSLTVSHSFVSAGNGRNLFPSYYVYYQWKSISFDYPAGVSASELRNNGSLIDANVIPTGIRIYKDRIFLSCPRYRRGVPSTVNSVPYDRFEVFGVPVGGNQSPNLRPFPSYGMQEIGNCTAFQNVQSTELDPYGRLWVADTGRVDLADPNGPRNLCPAKLVLLDLNNNDAIVSTYEFPNSVVSRDQGIIKDIQVACESRENCWAYISNAMEGNLVVYNSAQNLSWVASHPSMLPDPARVNFTINGVPTSVPYGINGLALAPRSQNYSFLYYSPLASVNLYRVNTSALQDPIRRTNPALQDSDVSNLGNKPGQSDGMAMDNRGVLYYGDLPNSAVYRTTLSSRTTTLGAQNKVAQSTKELDWPDIFSFDGRGNLLLTTTKFERFAINQINPNETNYRVVRFYTGSRAYSN